MLDRATLASLLVAAAAATAHADEPAPVTTTAAGTLVVVTPAAPVIVTSGGQVTAAPGAEEDPPAAPAGPSAIAATTTAPQNEAWSNVSHINGTPVPVGERNRYLYKFKKTNIAVNPFGLLFGVYDGSATFAVSQNLALSVSGTIVDEEYSGGYQITASVPLYFRRTFSGPYLEPGLMMRHTSEHVFDAGDDTNDWAGIELLFGWQWIFDSGLNLQLAMGVARHLSSSDSYSSDDAEANGYFRVGYAF